MPRAWFPSPHTVKQLGLLSIMKLRRRKASCSLDTVHKADPHRSGASAYVYCSLLMNGIRWHLLKTIFSEDSGINLIVVYVSPAQSNRQSALLLHLWLRKINVSLSSQQRSALITFLHSNWQCISNELLMKQLVNKVPFESHGYIRTETEVVRQSSM